MANKNYIERIQQVIFHLHKSDSTWVESVPVREVFQGQVIWDGKVEVFALRDHPKAKRCYGWSHPEGPDNKGERFVAVLEIPPVESAETAVKIAIAAEAKGKK